MSTPEGRPGALRRFLEACRSSTGIRVEVVLLSAAVVAAVWLSPRFRDLGRVGLILLDEMDPLAPVALVVVYVLASLLALPVFPFDLAAGAHFGFLGGVLWVQVAATLGALAGHELARGPLRGVIDRMLARGPTLRAVRDAVGREGWRIVFLARLSPILPYGLLNGLFGAARVPRVPYLLASFAGMLPGTALYVYAGVMAADLSGAPDQPAPTRAGLMLSVVGFAATAAVVVLVTRRAQRALRRRLGDHETTATSPAGAD